MFEQAGFALAAGDALELRGANGTGKTSLLRLIAAFSRPAQGVLRWCGRDIASDPAEHRLRVHFLSYADGIKGILTARENLAAAAAIAGGATGSVEGALAAFDLGDRAELPARLLSAGQRRRLALARLLAIPRPLWLLDEPGAALDRAGRTCLEAVIERHRAEGGVVVVATHGDIAVRDPLVLDFGERVSC